MSLWIDAACVGASAALFTRVAAAPPGGDESAAAKAVCRRCPVRCACLAWALSTDEPGVWGGLTQQERRRMRRTTAGHLRVLTAQRS